MWVYPRERGGTSQSPNRCSAVSGLSPASAGERLFADNSACKHRVYPRERGGTTLTLAAGGGGRGSIPASAGERLMRLGHGIWWWVYPRERGGTSEQWKRLSLALGLSPRARGNDRDLRDRGRRLGSIPASAGERASSYCPGGTSGVYPRERGGTTVTCVIGGGVWGLSPRARGNDR